MKRKINKKKNYHLVITIAIIIIVVLLSIGYSSFQNKLSIGDLSSLVRVDKDIRIMGLRVDSSSEATSLYEDYNVKNISSRLNLSKESSYLIYEVDVYNLGNVPMGIKDIGINNDKLKVEAIDYNLKDKICENDKCILGVMNKIKVKVSYKDGSFDSNNTTFDVRLDFTFGRIFSISYRNVTGDNLPTEIMEGDTLKISFTKTSNENLKIVMNNKFLEADSEYTYQDNSLTIPNVNGDISIILQGLTIMKKKLISNFIPSGDENDVPLYDFGAMSQQERKNLFGNVASESGIYRTNGFSGKNDAIIFRGNITNNYVRFAGYYFRILQIDENGNLRIILDDTLKDYTYYNTSSTISSLDEVSKVLGFQSSVAKTKLDNWTKYYEPWKDKVLTSNFCNDFSAIDKTSSGSKNKVYYFKSYQNIGVDINLYTPSLTCPTDSSFQSEIGLISAEEYVLAGGAFENKNTNSFLYNENINDYTWTLSPSFYDTVRANGDVFIIKADGTLSDYSKTLLQSYYNLRPVITINGDLEMIGDGTKNNPYRYPGTVTATAKDITDLSILSTGKWYIGSNISQKKVYGVLSGEVSTKLNNTTGLVGKDTAFFNERTDVFTNYTGIAFSFVNGKQTSDGYLYQLKTDDGKYLRINSDKSVELTEEESTCKIKLSSDSTTTGQVLITNEDESVYLNFYGSESGEGDDKFAGWSELDNNDYIKMYKLDFE